MHIIIRVCYTLILNKNKTLYTTYNNKLFKYNALIYKKINRAENISSDIF